MFLSIFQGGKGAPYYVGAAQTLPRGMYSDRNKNIIGRFTLFFHDFLSLAFPWKEKLNINLSDFQSVFLLFVA